MAEYIRIRFEVTDTGAYYIDDNGGRHAVVQAYICANGVRDLCIVQRSSNRNDLVIKKIANVKNAKDIVYVPEGDIFWARLEPPLDNSKKALIIDICPGDNELKELVKRIVRRFGGSKGKDYDMYAGEDY